MASYCAWYKNFLIWQIIPCIAWLLQLQPHLMLFSTLFLRLPAHGSSWVCESCQNQNRVTSVKKPDNQSQGRPWRKGSYTYMPSNQNYQKKVSTKTRTLHKCHHSPIQKVLLREHLPSNFLSSFRLVPPLLFIHKPKIIISKQLCKPPHFYFENFCLPLLPWVHTIYYGTHIATAMPISE